MEDGIGLESEKGKKNISTSGTDVVRLKTRILKAALQVQRCLDRVGQHRILKEIFIKVVLIKAVSYLASSLERRGDSVSHLTLIWKIVKKTL